MHDESESLREVMTVMAMKIIGQRLSHLNPTMVHETVGMDNLTAIVCDAFIGGLKTGCAMSDRNDIFDEVFAQIIKTKEEE